ncbi:MAG: hypothetical protein ACKO6D_00560, partial [Rubrivivax sp.]
VQEIALQHGAQVAVDDAHPPPLPPGARPGALFTVRFPVDGARAGGAGPQAAPAPSASGLRTG